MFYLFEIVNRTGAAVMPASALVFDMPTGAEGTTVLEGSTKNASAKGTRVTVTGPFAPGVTPLQIAFRLESLGSAAAITSIFPLPMDVVSVAVQKIGGMTVSSPQVLRVQERPLDTSVFVMGMGPRLAAGAPLVLQLEGLPYKSLAPVYVALALATAIVGVAVWFIVFPGPFEATGARRRALHERREKGLAAIAALDADHRAGRLDERAIHCPACSARGPARTYLWRARSRGRHDTRRAGRRRVSDDFDRLTLSDVSRHFGRRRALSHVSFSCAAGDIFGLLGPNGAGKSTLLSIAGHAAAPELRRRAIWRPLGAGWRRGGPCPPRAARARAAVVPGADGAPRTCGSSHVCTGCPTSKPALVTPWQRRRSPTERTMPSQGSLAGCGSGSPSSVPCCTIRGCCCSTSRSPGSTRRRRPSSSPGLRALAARGRIIVIATHDLDLAEGLLTRSVILKDGRVAALYDDGVAVRARYEAAVRPRAVAS